jgi:hypothetical protein
MDTNATYSTKSAMKKPEDRPYGIRGATEKTEDR